MGITSETLYPMIEALSEELAREGFSLTVNSISKALASVLGYKDKDAMFEHAICVDDLEDISFLFFDKELSQSFDFDSSDNGTHLA